MNVDGYIAEMGGVENAITWEERCLSIGEELLPDCARVVLHEDTGWSDAPSEYYEWLVAQHREYVREGVAS